MFAGGGSWIGATAKNGQQFGHQTSIFPKPGQDDGGHTALEDLHRGLSIEFTRRLFRRGQLDGIAQQRRGEHGVSPAVRLRADDLGRCTARQDLPAAMVECAKGRGQCPMQFSARFSIASRSGDREQLDALGVAIDQGSGRKVEDFHRESHLDAQEHDEMCKPGAIDEGLCIQHGLLRMLQQSIQVRHTWPRAHFIGGIQVERRLSSVVEDRHSRSIPRTLTVISIEPGLIEAPICP